MYDNLEKLSTQIVTKSQFSKYILQVLCKMFFYLEEEFLYIPEFNENKHTHTYLKISASIFHEFVSLSLDTVNT